MGKIESETRKQIMNYYNEKIGEIEAEQRKLKKLIEEKQFNEFYNDTHVILIKEHFKQLKERFENLNLKLECDIYKWDCCFKYDDNKYYKENQNKIVKLKKEKTQLLLTLENNSKTSNEYKKAINDFIKKVK